MKNILIWIDSSIKIKSKIIKMNNSLQKKFDNIILVTKNEKIASIYRSEFITAYSIQKIINKSLNKKGLNKIKINHPNLNSNFLDQIYLLGFHKESYLDNKFNLFKYDPMIELSIFNNLWLEFINKKEITHTLILNGFSIPSFALSFISRSKGLNNLFWENGLLPNSLFINKSGVNALSDPEMNIASEEFEGQVFDNKGIKDLINILSNNDNNNQNILVTLQVDNDSNIKIFSPFFGVDDFIYFICNEIAINSDFNIRFRNHPKNNFRILKKYKNLKNISVSDTKNSLNQDFNWSDLVITINSTTGLESILNKKPCISFGNSYYSKFLKKYKYKYLESHIPFYINDPANKEQKLNNQNLKDSLNQFSLVMQESEKVWENKILNNFKKEILPFHENNELIKYVTFVKYVRLRNNIRNKFKKILTFAFKKIMRIIQYINNQIL
jgi:hypothetical protein